MTLSVDALLVVSLMMAVFAAVSTIGVSLYLGAGHERLRAGFETIKKQTAFFSDAIRTLDNRVESVEKQSSYFFQAISSLEVKQETAPEGEPVVEEKLIMASKDDALHGGADLLTAGGFINVPQQPARSLRDQFQDKALAAPESVHFH